MVTRSISKAQSRKRMSRSYFQFAARLVSGSKCSISVVIWSLVGFLVMLHLYTLIPHINTHTKEIDINTSHDPIIRELEEIEEERIHMPPPRKRSPRAVKRKPKRPTTLIDEFLDESSPMRHVFFPSMKTAVDPRKDADNGSYYYFPGRIWLDTEGNPIQAHGGGILYDHRSSTYYWYGEYKDGPTYHAHKKGAARVDIIGVGCYSSKDLWSWKNEGIVLPAETHNASHDLHPSNVLERPKVIYNERTHKYVMWMHVDDTNYTRAHAGVAVGDRPAGPFRYLGSLRPHGCDSRDMTLFKDDDGAAYLIYSSFNNSELHVGRLTDDYLDLAGPASRILVDQHREAPALFKHRGTYYMITSGCTGWAPNAALAHAAESMMGPWETLGSPCIGGNEVYRVTTFFAQGTHVVPVAGVRGLFVFMADRWNPADLRDSRYVWLPLTVGGPADRPLDYGFGFPVWSRVSVYWHRRWRLPGRG
ncbi:Arabinanase/levansucrase/invertase [Striga hermonthica]|uniref:Arabinanase/levansucrase/invertase n=1 Tax=Striga hermonthica TaxID=68872 RepID=A0A9N7P0R5_STRHE|nr:Arabinanase/levansucrase/invertase [Striga hermonthica]